MKCEEVLDRMDGFLDDELAAEERQAVSNHLEGCTGCSGELEVARRLRDRVTSLPRTLEPPRDLWPAIASDISQRTVVRGRFVRRMLLAAAATVLIAGSMTIAFLAGRSSTTQTAEIQDTEQAISSKFLLASFEGLGVDDYEATRAELLAALDSRRGELSPETVDVVMDNLRLIDTAMAEIARALGNDPESEFLMKELARAYRRQIDLLQRAVRLPAEV